MKTNRVLIVDDKEENLYLLQALLQGNGYETVPASHGVEALQVARQNQFDLVISDILMPVMDGFALCREWKKDGKLKSVPFIFYTATYTGDSDRDFALGLGAERFIIKPEEPEKLMEIIRETIGKTASSVATADIPDASAVEDESVFLKKYNEALIRKLESKMEQLEQANRELEKDIAVRKRFMAAIEQTGEIVIITDTKGIIQYVNPAFERVTGYLREEAVGKTPNILKSGVQDEEFYRGMWHTITSGKTWEGRFVNKRKDGTLFTETATISPVRDDSGRTINYVAAKRDITEHLQLEAQLNQAQKMEAMGQLSGGVAHDFNNLLAIINGYSQLLLENQRLEEKTKSQIQEILRAGERASSLTRQLLVFSRRQEIEPQIIDINSIVSDMYKMLRRLVRESITITVENSPELWRIKADPGQLEQVIMNLVVNARDAMLEGGKINVKTENMEIDGKNIPVYSPAGILSGHYVVLSVTDNGCGMDEKIKERIFEPFFTTKEEGKGTGLGLATVYGIVKQSNGYIHVQSEVGKGTTFRIYLPKNDAKNGQTMQEGKEQAPTRGNETILLVDDEPAFLDMTAAMLENFGYRLLPAKTPGEAIQLAQEHAGKINLLMTDVIMPEMNGRELANKLLTFYPYMKHLYMSGYTGDIISQHGVLDKGTHFIQKPFSTKGLAEKVREALDDK